MYVYTHTCTCTHYSTLTGRHTQIAYLLTKRTYRVYILVLKVHLGETRVSTKKFTFTGSKITCKKKKTREIKQQLLIRSYIHLLMFSCKDSLLKQSLESKASISWQRAGERKMVQIKGQEGTTFHLTFLKLYNYTLYYIIHMYLSQTFKWNF